MTDVQGRTSAATRQHLAQRSCTAEKHNSPSSNETWDKKILKVGAKILALWEIRINLHQKMENSLFFPLHWSPLHPPAASPAGSVECTHALVIQHTSTNKHQNIQTVLPDGFKKKNERSKQKLLHCQHSFFGNKYKSSIIVFLKRIRIFAMLRFTITISPQSFMDPTGQAIRTSAN